MSPDLSAIMGGGSYLLPVVAETVANILLNHIKEHIESLIQEQAGCGIQLPV